MNYAQLQSFVPMFNAEIQDKIQHVAQGYPTATFENVKLLLNELRIHNIAANDTGLSITDLDPGCFLATVNDTHGTSCGVVDLLCVESFMITMCELNKATKH